MANWNTPLGFQRVNEWLSEWRWTKSYHHQGGLENSRQNKKLNWVFCFLFIFRQQEVKTIESTELYKRQYEQLLQEYNQYLEDLESVQSKLKGLETLKSTYEEENASLRELSQRYQSKAESLQEQVLLLLISAITFV